MAKAMFTRVHQDTYTKLVRKATDEGTTLQEIINKALFQYLESADEGSVTELRRSIATMVVNQKALKTELEMFGEMFSFYVLQWFCYAPVLPESQKGTILASAKLRHDKFIEQLQKRLLAGNSSISEVVLKESKGTGE